MTTDPLALSVHQQRQATLLYHWMSIEYLQGLKSLLDALIKGGDVTLALSKLQGRDQLLTSNRWGVRDTAANWSTFVYPALEDFRRSTIWQIAQVGREGYGNTGANECARLIGEFSSLWMTQDEEGRFKTGFDAVCQYAHKIDRAAGIGGRRRLNDFNMACEWKASSKLWPRLPKLQVRTDLEAASGKRPPRTGVYASQEDPLATLQFAWRGDDEGQLDDAQTFNDRGRHMVDAVGRDALWVNEERMASFALDSIAHHPHLEMGPYNAAQISLHKECGAPAMAFSSFTTRPCKWYFVEMIHGEFDDDAAVASEAHGDTSVERMRCEAGNPCPSEGFWFTPAQANSRRFFEVGEVMPSMGSDYGATIWQRDENQTASQT